MKLVIEGADFSAVSIGKVIKDFSFKYVGVVAISSILKNPPTSQSEERHDASSSGNSVALWYRATSGDSAFEIRNTADRFASNLIEVTEGMTIILDYIENGSTCPGLVAFDENKNVLPPNYASWIVGNTSLTYNVPSNVRFISIQASAIKPNSIVRGSMPKN